jgi:hypothetical protein
VWLIKVAATINVCAAYASDSSVHVKADVYAVGVIILRLMTGLPATMPAVQAAAVLGNAPAAAAPAGHGQGQAAADPAQLLAAAAGGAAGPDVGAKEAGGGGGGGGGGSSGSGGGGGGGSAQSGAAAAAAAAGGPFPVAAVAEPASLADPGKRQELVQVWRQAIAASSSTPGGALFKCDRAWSPTNPSARAAAHAAFLALSSVAYMCLEAERLKRCSMSAACKRLRAALADAERQLAAAPAVAPAAALGVTVVPPDGTQ